LTRGGELGGRSREAALVGDSYEREQIAGFFASN